MSDGDLNRDRGEYITEAFGVSDKYKNVYDVKTVRGLG